MGRFYLPHNNRVGDWVSDRDRFYILVFDIILEMHFNFNIIEEMRKMLIHLVLETETHNALILWRNLQLIDEDQGHSLLAEELHWDHVVNDRNQWGPVLKHFGNSINKIWKNTCLNAFSLIYLTSTVAFGLSRFWQPWWSFHSYPRRSNPSDPKNCKSPSKQI